MLSLRHRHVVSYFHATHDATATQQLFDATPEAGVGCYVNKHVVRGSQRDEELCKEIEHFDADVITLEDRVFGRHCEAQELHARWQDPDCVQNEHDD